MRFDITETINTVGWPEGISNAPADLVTKAKAMAEEGRPTAFGKIEGTETWVILSVSDKGSLYITARA
jgi:hypothetical protein